MTTIHSLLLIGSMQLSSDCAANPWCSEAMNVTQLELVSAFENCGVEHITVFSFPGSSSRNAPQRFKRRKENQISPNIRLIELPFVAFSMLQIISQTISLWWALARLNNPIDAILIINPVTRLYLPSVFWSALWRIPTVILASDLSPVISSRNIFRRFQQWSQIKVAQAAPAAAVFSSHLGRDLRPRRPWIRVTRPPATDIVHIDSDQIALESTYNIYFAGTMAEVSGVDLLLDATLHLTDANFRFWFSGRGPLDARIREFAKRDSRIIHWGFVERQTYIDLLHRATVLVNPRPSSLPENRYNFPSKLMEYLAAGRPVISTATSDVAEYYADAIILMHEETSLNLAVLIQKVCNLTNSERLALGQRAKASVQNETWAVQAKRLLNLMEGILS